jgi:LDH2 family malate/lactate/ureidoglycolate dehydrogenase
VAGFVALAFTNAEPPLPPWGSYEAIFGTNPSAIDLSTSIVARGKIVAAARTKTP